MAAYEFEKKLEQGYQVDDNQTFADYAQYVMELKQRSGLAATTLERYQGLLRRINPAIGHSLRCLDNEKCTDTTSEKY